MNGSLDHGGYLSVGRRGVVVKLFCPWASVGPNECGEWCPHFGPLIKRGDGWTLEICHGKTLYFKEFKD